MKLKVVYLTDVHDDEDEEKSTATFSSNPVNNQFKIR
jgi:hypothetical protein